MAASVGALRHGDRAAREVSARIGGLFATTAALTALGAKQRADGMLALVGTVDLWAYAAASSASAGSTVLVPDDSPTTGRWLKVSKPKNLFSFTVAADGAASTTTAETLLGELMPIASNISKIYILPEGTATASDSVYATITIATRNSAGGGATTIVAVTTKVTGSGGTGDWAKWTQIDVGTLASSAVAAYGIMTYAIAKASTGTQLPQFRIVVELA